MGPVDRAVGPWVFGDVRVSEARSIDALPMLALHRAVLDEEQWFVTLPDELSVTAEDRENFIRDCRRSENSVCVVARIGHDVVGWATLIGGAHQRTRGTARLEIMVGSAFRGKGVGKALMTALIDWAEHSPLHKLALNVFADNHRAIALYEAFGFQEEGRRAREYRLEDGHFADDVLMYRFVGPFAKAAPVAQG